jgi:hypothetical protein
MDGTVPVANNDIPCARDQQSFGHANACRTRTIYHNAGIGQILPNYFERVGQSGENYDGGTMLFMVDNGKLYRPSQPVYNGEAFGRLNTFQTKSSKGGCQNANNFCYLVSVLGLQRYWDRINVGEGLVDNRLCLQLGQYG